MNLGVTHIISWNSSKIKEFNEKFLFLNLLEGKNDTKKSCFYHIHKTMDVLRHCMVYKGITLFIDDFQYITNIQNKQSFLIRQLIVLSISFLCNLTAYDSLSYINSKVIE